MSETDFDLIVDGREIGMKLPPLREVLREVTGQEINGPLPLQLIEVYEIMDSTYLHDSVRREVIHRWAQQLDII